MVNGYVTLDLASNKIYKESLGAIASGKPVMVVDAPNVYFADTISIVSDNVVITKGGKTITITDANAVSSVGDIQAHLYQYSITFNGTFDENNLTFNLKFISNKSDITIDDLISNDIKSLYTYNTIADITTDGGANNFTIVAFKEGNLVNILDSNTGDNDWTYSNLAIAKTQLF